VGTQVWDLTLEEVEVLEYMYSKFLR
jgi:hypothetical protein